MTHSLQNYVLHALSATHLADLGPSASVFALGMLFVRIGYESPGNGRGPTVFVHAHLGEICVVYEMTLTCCGLHHKGVDPHLH